MSGPPLASAIPAPLVVGARQQPDRAKLHKKIADLKEDALGHRLDDGDKIKDLLD